MRGSKQNQIRGVSLIRVHTIVRENLALTENTVLLGWLLDLNG